ncbi:hypothetical protein T459_14224 [Capsicum annuum]|uniref:Uncharacterized protein n=1 Tax=Capsicum annuum TaxID=4072 RepID=A0A2G2ZGS8_CAPAN|nr:hypothetical protein T459_14224 [Capsicum annuum]
MESKFIALDKAGEEAEWLRNFLEDIPYWPKPVAPVCIHCDSQAAICRAGNMMYNGKSHHIQWRHNTIRELLSSGIITIDYVKSKDNVSDPLTKGLFRKGVERTSKGMGLRPKTSQHGDFCVPDIMGNNNSFVAGAGDDDGFDSCLKTCTCICRKETKFYKVGKETQSLKRHHGHLSQMRDLWYYRYQ